MNKPKGIIEVQNVSSADLDVVEELVQVLEPQAILSGSLEGDAEIIATLESEASLIGSLGIKNEVKVEVVGSGPRGKEGKDAYALWLEEGNEGSLDEFFRVIGGDGYTYVHPKTHSAEMIVETIERNFISESEKEKALETYIHDQLRGSAEWTIEHNLNKYPSVSVVDSGDSLVGGSVQYVSKNELVITFTAAFSGKAYLN